MSRGSRTAMSTGADRRDAARGRGGWAGLWAGFTGTWRAMLADKGALMLLFVGGVIYSFFYPLPYAHEVVQQVPVAIVDQDHSPLSRQIVRFALAHPGLKLVEVTPEPARAQDLLWRNDVGGVLFIPEGLNRRVLAGWPAEVEITGNGLYLMLGKVGLGGLAEAVGTVSAGAELKRLEGASPSLAQVQAQRQPLTLNTVALFNVREGYGAYVVPGVAVLVMQQTLLMAVALMFGTWHERGGVPLGRHSAEYAGLVLACASVVWLNAAYWFGFVLWWHGYPRGADPLALAGFTGLYGLAVATLGVALGMLFRSRERSAQLLVGVAMPLMFVAGLSWPAEALPPLLQTLRWALPSTAGIQGFVALNQLGARWSDVGHEVLVLAGLTALFAAWGLWRWHRPHRA